MHCPTIEFAVSNDFWNSVYNVLKTGLYLILFQLKKGIQFGMCYCLWFVCVFTKSLHAKWNFACIRLIMII